MGIVYKLIVNIVLRLLLEVCMYEALDFNYEVSRLSYKNYHSLMPELPEKHNMSICPHEAVMMGIEVLCYNFSDLNYTFVKFCA